MWRTERAQNNVFLLVEAGQGLSRNREAGQLPGGDAARHGATSLCRSSCLASPKSLRLLGLLPSVCSVGAGSGPVRRRRGRGLRRGRGRRDAALLLEQAVASRAVELFHLRDDVFVDTVVAQIVLRLGR